MKIKRDRYLDELKIRMHNGMIKIITGIRRSGKSYLLFEIFYKYLIDTGINKNHIIAIKLDNLNNDELLNPKELLKHITSKIKDNNMYYILLDEVQLLNNFVGLLNSLLHISNVDVYVTGSNSRFLSKDVVTEFRGRGDEIHLFPLSFKEYTQVFKEGKYKAFDQYLLYGGLPLILSMSQEKQKIDYLNRLFNLTYLKDIVDRYRVDKISELNSLIDVLASSVGSLTNSRKIEKTFKSELHSDITDNTIKQYLEYLEDAFIVSKAHRYDVKGRKYINTPFKYYFEDVGLRNARLGFRQYEQNHLMENVIYNELRLRGYAVDVGVIEKRVSNGDGKLGRTYYEIDFVANLGSRRFYIQSAFAIPDDEKRNQETRPLIKVNDSFKKIIIVKDEVSVTRDINGIVTMSIYDFLLNEDSLETC